jgi:MarR family transcriptional regulator for hemolysin
MAEQLDLLRNLAVAARELSAAFDAHFKDLNLTSARARVLLLLLPNEAGVSQARVTEHLRVEHPTAVRILDGLESCGFIQRLPALEDRRAKIIVLTEEGRSVAAKVTTLSQKLSFKLVSPLDRAEAEIADRVLLRLQEEIQLLKASAQQNRSDDGMSA